MSTGPTMLSFPHQPSNYAIGGPVATTKSQPAMIQPTKLQQFQQLNNIEPIKSYAAHAGKTREQEMQMMEDSEEFTQSFMLKIPVSYSSMTLEEAERVVQEDPLNALAWKVVGERLEKEQRYLEASAAWYAVSQIDASDADAFYALGYCRRMLQDYHGAASAYQCATEVDGAQCCVGWVFWQRCLELAGEAGQAAEVGHAARRAFEHAIEADPADVGVRSEFASYLARTEDVTGAIVAAAEAVQLSPDNAELHRRLGRYLLRSADANKAAVFFRRANELKETLRGLLDLMRALEKSENTEELEEAVDAADRALELTEEYYEDEERSRKSAWIWSMKSTLLAKLDCDDDARIALERSVELSPEEVYYRLRLIKHKNLGVKKASGEALDELIKKSSPETATPLVPHTLVLIADMFNNAGESSSAEKVYFNALRLLREQDESGRGFKSHEDAEALLRCGHYFRIHAKSGGKTEATDAANDMAEWCYRRCIDTEPEHCAALTALGIMLTVVRKDDVEAEKFLLRAVEADPEAYLACSFLGRMYVFRGDHRNDIATARFYLEKAMNASSEQSPANYRLLGWAHERLGDLKAAAECLETAKRLIASHPKSGEDRSAEEKKIDKAVRRVERRAAAAATAAAAYQAAKPASTWGSRSQKPQSNFGSQWRAAGVAEASTVSSEMWRGSEQKQQQQTPDANKTAPAAPAKTAATPAKAAATPAKAGGRYVPPCRRQ